MHTIKQKLYVQNQKGRLNPFCIHFRSLKLENKLCR
jgi:hypothetical protein